MTIRPDIHERFTKVVERADRRVAEEWAALRSPSASGWPSWGRSEQGTRGLKKSRVALSLRKRMGAEVAEARSQRQAKSTPGAHHKSKTMRQRFAESPLAQRAR